MQHIHGGGRRRPHLCSICSKLGIFFTHGYRIYIYIHIDGIPGVAYA